MATFKVGDRALVIFAAKSWNKLIGTEVTITSPLHEHARGGLVHDIDSAIIRQILNDTRWAHSIAAEPRSLMKLDGPFAEPVDVPVRETVHG